MTSKLASRLVRLMASAQFFYGIIALFVLESAWIAFSARYPMAFDEDFHLGIIKLYAQQWTPFFASQPVGGDTFGAVARDPSYLQHYLFSFPYRLTESLFHSQFVNILTLRFLDIAAMAIGLLISRRLLRYATKSEATINVVLLFFVLTPTVPFLAAQINYDALLFPVVAAVLLLTVQVARRLRQGAPDMPRYLTLLSLCGLASLIKYSFLPVFFAIVVFLALELRRLLEAKRGKLTLRQFMAKAKQSFASAPRRTKISVLALFVVAAGLFTAMYGYNALRYHTPIPECNQVLDAKRCTAYGAWYRNYQYVQTKEQTHQYVNPNPLEFTLHWGQTYLFSTFFAVNGIYSGFIIGRPFPVLHIASLVFFWLSLPLLLWQLRRLWRQAAARLFLIVIAIYIAALWFQNFSDYLHLGQHVAEHGRYYIMLLPAAYLLFAMALGQLVRQRWLRLALVAFTLLLFTQGGGPLTYIMRSDPTWWWEHDNVVTYSNWTLQRNFKRYLIGSNKPNIYPWVP